MKQTKFDLLALCYRELVEKLRDIDQELIQTLIKSWELSFSQMEEYLEAKQVTKSQMVSGLTQGLKDLPDLFDDLLSPYREVALQALNDTLVKNDIS